MNKLPEKLTLLRKYNNLSQGDIATKLGIPVTEYMQWENGNRIPPVSILKNIADLFGITVDLLVDNTQTIVFPEKKLEQSATIPFNGGSDINATQVFDESLEKTRTMSIPTEDDNYQEEEEDDEVGHTRVMDANNLPEEDDDEEDEEPVTKKKVIKKKPSASKKKKSIIIVVAVAVVIAVAALLILLFRGASSTLNVGSDNRLAVGSTFSLYVDNDGNVKKYGQLNTSISSAVQVSAYEDHALALDKKGTVTSSLSLDLSEWKSITYIAAGKDHAVGVTSEGKVVCEGNDAACKVSGWSNISSVYAGDGFTVGLTNDGAIKVSGNNTDAIANESNVRSISTSNNLIVVTKKDGTVKVYPIGSATELDTSSWSDVQSTAAGNNLIAGLNKNGTVSIACNDEEITKTVSSWKNIKYLAANGSTVVGINSSGQMVGAGDNTYNQYVNSVNDDTDESEGQLDEVKNIQVNATTANVVIKWDTVENADYYEVSIEGITDSATKTTSNSTSIPASSLTDGQSYTITVIAKNNDEEKYKESTGTLTFTYTAKTVQLATPSGLTAKTNDDGSWEIQWAAVEHADSYKVSIGGGEEFEVSSNTYTANEVGDEATYTVTVKACSSNPSYSESETYSQPLQYTLNKYSVYLNYYLDGTRRADIDKTIEVSAGTYSWYDLDVMAGSYAQNNGYTVGDGSVTVSKDNAGSQTLVVAIYLNKVTDQ